jgi:predicted NUDIX family NTP pyrophosphohydrolase
MIKKSAGILLFRFKDLTLQIFLVHPGGPFWSKKENGAWSIPKGEFSDDEDPREAAKREFKEETGEEITIDLLPLTPIKQKSGKVIHAFAGNQDLDEQNITSNTFTIEWPPRSGKMEEFPEVDKGEWFDIATAKEKLNGSQICFIDELLERINPGRQAP